MERQEELRHLREGPRPNEKPPPIDYLIAHCPGNAEVVLKKTKEVLEVVLSLDPENWPSDSEWASILPRWFLDASGPNLTRKEAEEYLARLKGLPPEERVRVEAKARWSTSDFLYWFRSDERFWYWWDGKAESADELRVAQVFAGWPYPTGALEWLLRASGAIDAEKEI